MTKHELKEQNEALRQLLANIHSALGSCLADLSDEEIDDEDFDVGDDEDEDEDE